MLPLQDEDLAELARRALTDAERGVGIPSGDARPPYALDQDALEHLLLTSNGDARRLLGTIEGAVQLAPDGGAIDLATIEKAAGRRAVSYDKGADEHYAVISRLHQVDPRLGPRRGAVLAGPHGGRRRGAGVHRPPAGHLRLGGDRSRRLGRAHRRRLRACRRSR